MLFDGIIKQTISKTARRLTVTDIQGLWDTFPCWEI